MSAAGAGGIRTSSAGMASSLAERRRARPCAIPPSPVTVPAREGVCVSWVGAVGPIEVVRWSVGSAGPRFMPTLIRTGGSMAASHSPQAVDREGSRRPPRFVVRVLIASFTTVVLVLVAVIALLGYQARQAVEVRVREELEAGHRLVAMSQAERQRNATVQATVLTQSDALANAFEQFRAGRRLAGDDDRLTALEWELRSIEALLDADVVGVTDEAGRVLCASGRFTSAWSNQRLLLDSDAPGPFEAFVTAHDQPFAVTAAPIRVRGGRIGHLVVGTALD